MARDQRLVFGEVAELYDKARPSYPRALIDHLSGLVGPASRVLDAGCGTGKATVLLAARGLHGVGLEPDPAMAAVAARNLCESPSWIVRVGEFERYDDDRPFDLITCAQAWHWLNPQRRFYQAARLLRHGGWLALFWNRTADDSTPLRREVDDVYAELLPAASPHGPLTAGQPPAGSPPPDAGFGDPQAAGQWRVFPWVRRYTTPEWIDLVQTHSDHRMLPPELRRALIARVAEVVDAHGGVYDHPYNCWSWTARKAVP